MKLGAVELNTLVNCKQYVLKMMVFRQIPNLILINWMQDFDQHEKNRHYGSRHIPDLWRSSAGEQVGENIPNVMLLLVAQAQEQGPLVVQLFGKFCTETRRI
ncbi:uncharacterized protein [Taeniopygia guttata]|uniref:uncharacterized protein isoform X11 n=1 Tax=Taeniopygia guttata TaxID=59729 RepID=UPI003BB87998